VCACAQASPEWRSANDPLPVPLGPGGSIYGVPYDSELFVTGATAVGPAQPPAAAAAAVAGTPAARVAALLSSASMKSSIAQMDSFISSYNSRPDLNVLLHEPALKRGSSSAEGAAGQVRGYCCCGARSPAQAAALCTGHLWAPRPRLGGSSAAAAVTAAGGTLGLMYGFEWVCITSAMQP